MYFDLDDEFFHGEALGGRYEVKVRVVYFDQGRASWALKYDAVGDPQKTAFTLTKTGSDRWQEKTVTITDGNFFNGGPRNADLVLVNTDDEDDIFHMIEVTRTQGDRKGHWGDGTAARKPKVWIYTDMSDKTLPGTNHMGTINDPDDMSAMAGYLLMCNQFETKGIVVASTHRKEHKTTPDQAEWANRLFGAAYRANFRNLNRNIGGYPDPEQVRFMQSCIKESAERYQTEKVYDSLEGYGTVKALLDTAEADPGLIYVLCWGSLTEPAILVNHCLNTGKQAVLEKLRFIAHWTNSSLRQGTKEHPERVANCNEDAQACAYLKQMALEGRIKYFECGAIGQAGIVRGSPKGREYYDQFKVSHLGRLFAEGKFYYDCVDHSDAATYWVLLGEWGVSLNDIRDNGTNPADVEQANEERFREWSGGIHDELLGRSIAAANE
jgi:hypothetical protein